MPLKVNEFVIRAKVIEDDQKTGKGTKNQSEFSKSVKQEIIDECISRMKELIEKEKLRY